MIAVMMIVGIIGALILSHLWEMRQQRALKQVDTQVLDDNILSYHLDWEILQTEEFKLLHFVKKVNATRRYSELTGVTREQAWHAIDDISFQTKRKIRRMDDVIDDEQHIIHRLLQQSNTDDAAQCLADSMGVDKFTAQEALAYIQQELAQRDGV